MARDHPLTRRDLTFGIVGLASKSPDAIQGALANESVDMGHRIRDHARFQTPAETRRVPLVIVGGGIAGLSAAWRLDKRGFRDFVLLEMESEVGGNARWGRNEITPYPWAAHYVPVLGKGPALVRELFEELGILKNGQWDEHYLCHSPQERIFIHGRWQEGLPPQTDHQQWERFEALTGELRQTGCFTIPMEQGWRKCGARERALDRMSMEEWLAANGLHSPEVRWYANYACRDDYGASSAATSAWAGLHYFASREPDDKGPIVQPQGNGWIVQRLEEKLRPHIHRGRMVYRIVKRGAGWQVFTEQTRFDAQAVIFAAPTFLGAWLIDPAPPKYPLEYSPWLTANLTLERWPEEQDTEPAWDNVIYDSKSLGYVVATHQSLKVHQRRTVWTWYHSFSEGSARDQRRLLLGGDWSYWKEFILRDLERAHPDIRACVSRVDIMRLGHAMPRPGPGAMFAAVPSSHAPSLFFANSDVSRLPLFEEAQYRGVAAAAAALRLLGRA
ncbi:MAG: FAD-dependent oxidoreductase [Bryobacterales bacterium]|nr:FAD-dependent oxidoreductase [Bryobacterales bacterium]